MAAVDLTDEELMAAFIADDRSAFQELFSRYQPLLHRAMSRALYNREEANDLVQQVFLQVYRSRFDFRPGCKLKPWVFTIALNLKRDYFRRCKRRSETSFDETGVAESSSRPSAQERADLGRDITRALRDLPAGQREVIELHWFAGLSFPEIAEVLAATLTAVKVRAHRGYRLLRTALGDDGPRFTGELADAKTGRAVHCTTTTPAIPCPAPKA